VDVKVDYDPLARIALEPGSLEAFYRDHLEVVRRFVARRVSDPHTAADLTADIFVAAIDSCRTYDPDRGSVAAWLCGVGRHVLAAQARQRCRGEAVARRIHGARMLDEDAMARVEERLDAEREARRVYRAVGALSDCDQALFELVALDGLSISDAARALGVKPATARVRLHRARARVIAHLRTPDTPTCADTLEVLS
jgi:RNA polymerase sigma factor (sigma-70 family)